MLGAVNSILGNPRYTGRRVWNRQRTDTELADPANIALGHRTCRGGTCPTAGSSPRPRDLRAAYGISLVQRQARLPVPSQPHQRRPARSRPAEERLRPGGQDPGATARPAQPADLPAAARRRCARQAPHQMRHRDERPANAGDISYLRAGAASRQCPAAAPDKVPSGKTMMAISPGRRDSQRRRGLSRNAAWVTSPRRSAILARRKVSSVSCCRHRPLPISHRRKSQGSVRPPPVAGGASS
jgi:hypothetical protein